MSGNLILELIVNGMMALLLAVTLYFCNRLNSRIKVLQDNRSELAETIREFDACTRRAAESIAEIHTVTQRISENIQMKIDKANFIADDLQFMIERGNKMADKMEPSPTRAAQTSATPSRPAAAAAPTTPRRETPAPSATKPLNAGGAEVLAKASVSEDGGRGQRVRSRAEQELMDVVKTSTKDPV